MYLFSENKDADQLLGSIAADLRICFRAEHFFHDAVHLLAILIFSCRSQYVFML